MTATYRAVQPSFDDMGTPLIDVTFCVVDLETTGGGPDNEITEVGAVLVRGGEVQAEFQTLVRPDAHIPASIAVLTGITNAMVADAPRIGPVISSFMSWSAGATFVAHNAGFDIGFLKRACQGEGLTWPDPVVVDTVALARNALLRDEVPNCRLATLARHFDATTQPNHRALSDARATVDVLHGLLARVGSLGVSTLEDLDDFTRRVSPDRRAKRTWADGVPERPGVYWFTSGSDVLYVGRSTNLKRRVRSYFTASETRARIHEMVRVADGCSFLECATGLEAAVRELRMIAAHAPRYNRRSRRQHQVMWLKLTQEAFPRLSVVGQLREDGARYFGPFANRDSADQASLAIYDAFPVRRCTTKLSATRPAARCALAEIGKCRAPCETLDVTGYADVVSQVSSSWESDVRPLLESVAQRLRRLSREQRYEEAAEVTGRVRHFTRTSRRWHRLRSVASCEQIIAAAPEGSGWAVHVIRYGRLAASGTTRRGEHPLALADRLGVIAETVLRPAGGAPAASVEETELVAGWLESPGVRLIELVGEWSWPLHGTIAESDLPGHLLGQAL